MPVTQRSIEDQNVHHWALTAEAEEITHWRGVVAQTLRGWGAPLASVELACLGVSELLANVIRHAGDRRCQLNISRVEGSARLSVLDRSQVLPKVSKPDWNAESGRGLWLLQQMAGEGRLGFQFAPAPWGKEVWLQCDLVSECEVAA
jgi:anti-sigma regulatory factor (Ser/Thr protein kinase)